MNKQTRAFPIPTGFVIILVLLVAILGYMILTGSSRALDDSLYSECPVCEHVMYPTDQVNETYIVIAAPQESVSDEFTRSMLQVLVCDECGAIYVARWNK